MVVSRQEVHPDLHTQTSSDVMFFGHREAIHNRLKIVHDKQHVLNKEPDVGDHHCQPIAA